MEIEAKDLQPIADLINLIYSGEPKDLIDDLYLNMYLLHHVDPDTVQKEEMDRVVFLLKSLCDGFKEVSNN